MDKDAIIHRPMSEYAFGTDENTTVFRLRCASGGAERCTLWYGDTSCPETPVPFYPAPMRLLFRGENCDWWEAELHGKFHRLYYYFELSGGETLFFSGGVFLSTPSEERSEYFKFPFNHRADITRVPDWANDAVVYNIFPDSFASSKCAVTGVGSEKRLGCALSRSRLGGTINGIRSNLDYIASLGVNCLYLNPVFAAGQYHKYDTIDYLHIDPCFGTDEDFRALVDESHVRGIRVILDGVFNHCGAQFFAFRDVLEKQGQSRYAGWFYRLQFPVRYPDAGEKPNYECFCYERLMPKLDTANPEVRDYLCGVGEHWLREYGTDGWRLDVADEVDDAFWREFRRRCKAVKSDALLIGEVWGDARHWLGGDMLDSAMNYDFRNHCRHFFAEGNIDARTFAGRCADMLMRYKRQTASVQLNILDSHDTGRFLSLCGGDTRRLKLAVLFMCCFVGMPCIFYGDELGVEGQDELDYRRAMPWQDGDLDMLRFYREVIALRRAHPALRHGELRFLRAEPGEHVLVFERKTGVERLVITINASDKHNLLPPFSWDIGT
ncbi:MAG TPA: glycoside hydrolase family 13 protein [Candidatus Scatomorpha intestinavium]|uniref:Glycoside hydrolase family 13 protein n=1 Tax=Candidatus Scatomorpha intestinavium TaxID=2840922 RepID=A0A9D0ZHN4_9FIRM|nr:glycoside hydrolase family 13 protein [Candidatus Scatomorpha intestinavium]